MTRTPQTPASTPASPPAPAPVFGQRRPSVDRGHSQSSPLYAGSKGQPLPAPTGPAPLRIDLASVTPEAVARMRQAGRMALHKMARDNGQDIATPYRAPDEPNVYLESYVDDRFGFLRLEFTPGIIDLRFITVPRPQEPRTRGNRLYDRMRYDWRRRTIVV